MLFNRTLGRSPFCKVFLLLLCAVCFFVPGYLQAQPEISGASLRNGYSPRMHQNSWSLLKCTIKNPDNKKHEIVIRLLAIGEVAHTQKNVFSDTITIPANSKLDYKTTVQIEYADKYRLEAYIDGVKETKLGDEAIIMPQKKTIKQFGVINDLREQSFGSIVQRAYFKGKDPDKRKMDSYAVNYTANSLPDVWYSLTPNTVLFVLHMDIKQYSSRQLRALLDYVRQGGIIIFADPEGIQDLVNSPLAELLPVIPGKLRKLEDLPALKKIAPRFNGFPENGGLFLESYPSGDGVTFLKNGEFPTIRWKKYGLGSCRFSAIALTEDNFKSKDAWSSMVKYFIKTQDHFSEYDKLNKSLDSMIGFSVPDVSIVENIFMLYLGVVFLLVVIGKVTRKSGLAWTMAALVAIGITLYVLDKAQGESAKKGKMLSSVKIKIAGASSEPTETFFSFFSGEKTKIELTMDKDSSSLSLIPPNPSTLLGFSQQGMRIQSKLDVRRNERGLATFEGIDLPPNSVKQFYSISTDKGELILNDDQLPRLKYRKDGFKLQPWKAPDPVKFEKAFLLLPSGSFELDVRGREISLKGRDTFVSDDITHNLRVCLDRSFRKTAPAIALVKRIRKPAVPVDGDFLAQGREVIIIPVREDCDETMVTVDAEQIILNYADPASRIIMNGNTIRSAMENSEDNLYSSINGESTFAFSFTLPPLLSCIEPEEIIVDFQYLNQGGNIKAEPLLGVDGSKLSINRTMKTSVRTFNGKRIPGGKYSFKGAELTKVIDPLTGSGYVMIEAKERNRDLSVEQKLKANKWDPISLKITIKGRLPQVSVPFKY